MRFNIYLVFLLSTLLYSASMAGLQNLGIAVKATPACEINPSGKFIAPCNAIVQFDSKNKSLQANSVRKADGKIKESFKRLNASAVQINSKNGFDVLKQDKNVVRIIPDRAIRALRKPSSPQGNKGGKDSQIIPSGVLKINAQPNMMRYKGAGIGVAVVDTGIDLDNPDLNISSSCWFYPGYGSCNDFNGHGTHVSGIISAKNNNIGVVGVASESTVYPVKALDDNGSGSDSTIMLGLEWILQNYNLVYPNIKVANLSLGRPGSIGDNELLHSLIQDLIQNGITVVVSAGNDPSMEVSQMVPATYPEVISVASTTATNGSNKCRSYNGYIHQDTASSFTTDGKLNTLTGIGVTISAPGSYKEDITRSCRINPVGILSLGIDSKNTRLNGTSMAAPHVSGIVAALYEYNSNLTVEQIKSELRSSANGVNSLPVHSPATVYSYDGEKEGVLSSCGILSSC